MGRAYLKDNTFARYVVLLLHAQNIIARPKFIRIGIAQKNAQWLVQQGNIDHHKLSFFTKIIICM